MRDCLQEINDKKNKYYDKYKNMSAEKTKDESKRF